MFLKTGFILLTLWLAAIIFSPVMMQSENEILKYIATAIYWFMDPVCHQLPERSIFIDKLPMPVCGRCFFIYSGGFLIFFSA